MRTRTFVHALLSAALLGCAVTAAPVPEQKKLTPEEIAKAEKAAKERLSRLKGDAGMLQLIQDEPLGRALPRWAFFSVLFRQYPVARPAPPGLKPSNVFAVSPGGSSWMCCTVPASPLSLASCSRAAPSAFAISSGVSFCCSGSGAAVPAETRSAADSRA